MIQHRNIHCSARARWPMYLSIGVLALVVGSSPVFAQELFDIQQFNPTPSQFTGFFTQPSGRVVEGGRWEIGLLFNYADDPLVLYDYDDERIASLVSAQLTGNVLAAVGIANWLDIGLDVPVILYQTGEEGTLLPAYEATEASLGLGDIRVVPRLMLIGPRKPMTDRGVALGLLVDTRIPIGNRDQYQGEGFRIEPKLALDLGWSRFRLGGALGYLIRTDPTEAWNAEVDDSLNWSLAAGFTLARGLELIPEIHGGAMLLADEIDLEEVPLEAALGLKWFITPSFLLQAGGGAGLIRGVGTPDFRVFLGMSFSPERKADRDRDGVADEDDVCPDTYGEREDGCPDPDRDDDQVCDPWVGEQNLNEHFAAECRDSDVCPTVYGERADGCPDPDRDDDQVCDPWVGEQNLNEHFAAECRASDVCPDTFGEREDGCPDPDPDGDRVCSPWVGELNLHEHFASVCSRTDACPDVYGEGEDGCPMAVATCVAIEISERIYFANDSDVIEQRSYRVLNEVAQVLQGASWIRRVRVEGHTDGRASASYNLDLSRRRANSVRNYLIERGIAPERLEAEGYGLTRPIADNETEEGRAMNRRVEFVIIEQQDCPEQPVSE